MALRTVGVRLTADISQYTARMRQAGQDAKSLSTELATAARNGNLDAVADQAGVVGLGLVGAAGAAVKFSMDFEKSMSAVSAATHASAGDMEQLRQAALEAGKDTQYSATEAANAITELSKAGVSTTDVLNGGLDGALDLAAAGSMDVSEAAETAASAMVQFKLKGQDLPHVADLLAAAAGKAQGTVHDMGQALNQAGLVAAQTGLSIEETTGGLAAFASAGLTGSDAGTSFKQMLLMLQAPSDTTRGLMEELGITAYDSAGQFIGLTNLAQQLRDKLGHLTPELRANAMAQIFGADAVRGASILYEQGGAGIQDWIGKVNDAGYASETAAKLTDNLAGDLERLRGELETMAIQSGSGANSGLRVLAQGAEALVSQFGQLPPLLSGTATVLAGVTGALVLGAAGWVKMRQSNAAALEELRSTGPGGERAARGLEATTRWAGRAAAAFAATQIAAAGVSAAFGDNLNPQTTALADSLTKWATSGEKSGEAARLLGDEFQNLGYDLGSLDESTWAGVQKGVAGTIESLTGLGSVFDQSLEHARERIGALDAALAQMVSSGQAGQAAVVFEKLKDEAVASGISVDELRKGLPQYTSAVQTAGSASSTSADQVEDVGAAAEATAEQVQKANDAFNDLFDAQMSADRAAIKLEESTVALNAEFAKGAKDLRVTTEEGRKNRSAVLDQIEAIQDLRQARLDEGQSLDSVNRKYSRDVESLRKSMIQAGFNERQVNELIGAYKRVPQQVPTNITTPGLNVAREGIKGYDKQLDSLHRKIRTEVSVVGKDKAYKELEDLLMMQQAAKKGITVSEARAALGKNFAFGGWTGPGDTFDEAGIVHADEFVIKKSSRKKIEAAAPGLLDYMNKRGQVPEHIVDTTPGYATGGRVMRMPFPITARYTMIPDWAPPPSGATGPWMEKLLESRFGVQMISGYRPGSTTLSGNRSYHSLNRAVDFPPIKAMARYMYENYKGRLREAITPWHEYNVHNGQNHRYTGAVWRQHAFGYGNAHNHFAMKQGGTIREPILGIGASGRTYSFGENWMPERVTPVTGGGNGISRIFNINVTVSPLSHPREVGRQVVESIQAYEQGSGASWREG